MSKWMNLSGTTALVTLMTSSAAFADVTAQQVWGDWKSYFETFGYSVTGSEATSGDTLTVTDMTLGMDLPEGAGAISIVLPEMSFTNQGDGTVAVGVPETMPVVVDVAPTGEEPVKVTVDYNNTGFSMIVSGTAEEMTYTYSAAEMAAILKELIVEGEAIPINAAEFTFANVSGSSVMKMGNLRNLEQVMNAGPISYNVDVANPDDSNEFMRIKGGMDKIAFQGTAAYPMGGGFDPNNMHAMLQAGFAFDGGFEYQGGKMNFHFIDGQEEMMTNTSTESGAFDIGMSTDGLKYDVMSRGATMDLQGGDIPFPVNLKFGEAGFKLHMPVTKSDESQEFALGITLGNFTMSDMIWGMFDPAGQLPRDPATIAVDLAGTGKLGFDLLDPEQMEAVESGEMGMPGEVESLTIKDIEVTAAGASLTGTGAFEFDMQSMMMSGGMQGSDGTLDLRLAGANGLMDKLVAMGLVPEDQVMGARMMLSMFAVPGDGDDVLTSKIEVKKDGQILANGQRLQ